MSPLIAGFFGPVNPTGTFHESSSPVNAKICMEAFLGQMLYENTVCKRMRHAPGKGRRRVGGACLRIPLWPRSAGLCKIPIERV